MLKKRAVVYLMR